MAATTKHHHPPLWLILSLFAAIAILQLPVATLITYSARWGIVINEIVILLALPLVALKCFGFRPRSIISWQRPSSRHMGASLALIMGTAIALCYLLAASQHYIPLSPLMLRLSETPIAITGSLDYFFTLLLFCVVAPICEEVLFRGLLQTSLTRRIGTLRACLFTALFFALIHGNDWYPHLYFVLGCVLSLIYARTGTLRTPILCHMANNTFVLLLRQTGWRIPLSPTLHWENLALLAVACVFIAFSGFSLLKKNHATS